MYLSSGDSEEKFSRIGVLGGVAGSLSKEGCLPPKVGIPVLGLEAACSCPLGKFPTDFCVDACFGNEGILLLVSTGEDAAVGLPVGAVSFSALEVLRVNSSPA